MTPSPNKEGWMTNQTAPAILPALRRAAGVDMRYGHREFKMLAPKCDICCPNTAKAARGWWDECPHDPYVGERVFTSEKPTYEDVLDEQGKPTGERVIGEKVVTKTAKPWPNFRGISGQRRNSGNRGRDYRRERFGYIMPSELKGSLAFPNGVAECCEYRNCFAQKGLKTYATGNFCREEEAVMCAEDFLGTIQEIHDPTVRANQLAESTMKLKAAAS